jgi:hypothetical protein
VAGCANERGRTAQDPEQVKGRLVLLRPAVYLYHVDYDKRYKGETVEANNIHRFEATPQPHLTEKNKIVAAAHTSSDYTPREGSWGAKQ